MNWNQIVDRVKPYLVKIKTPTGSGSGFLCLYNSDKTWCGIATAAHVVDDVDEWKQPIKIIHQTAQRETIFLTDENRVIFLEPKTDSAIIFFKTPSNLTLPDTPLRLRPLEQNLDIGSEIGWLGYPYLEEDALCFFKGSISARNENRKYYLMDGVAINGVSGGPVIFSTDTEGIEIVGIISAYMANRSTGATLPGLSIAQDISHLHNVVATIRSIDQAREEKKKMKQSAEVDAKKLERTNQQIVDPHA